MASTLLAVRHLAVLLLGIKCVFGNTCDCETVKDILNDEIFDLKAENKHLESRIEKMELTMQTKTPISYQSGKIGMDRIEVMETRISAIETKMPESTKYSRNTFKLQNLIAKALRSEKEERLKSKLKIASGLKKINDSLKAFNVQSNAVFGSHIANISNRIRDIRTEFSQNISVVRNEVTAVSNYAANLAHQANSLMENKTKTIEMSIDATKHDVSKMGADLHTVIDTVKTELSDNISVLRNEVTTVSNKAEKLVHQANSLMENKIKTIEMSIDATKHDVSKMGADLHTVIDTVKTELSENISVLRNEVTTVSNNAEKLVHQANSLMENKITTIEMSIDATKHDVSKMGADLNTVIDIVLLDQIATCKQTCTNGGVCFRNMCKCKPFTEGPRCEKVICEDKCYENGGRCVGPGRCECPENRHGPNCEQLICDSKCLINGGTCVGPGDCACPHGKFGDNCEQISSSTEKSSIGGQTWISWSVPKCKRISPFYGGEVIYTVYTEGRSNAFYSCEDAYSLFPRDIDYSNCTKHHKWKPKPPKCLRKAEVEIPDHGKVCKGKSDIILHSEWYAVCCDSGYELYNDRYLEKTRARIRNNNGSLEPKTPECVEARCDPSDQYMANVQYLNGSNIMTKFPSWTVVLLSCKDGFGYYRGDRPMTTPLIRTCVKGSIRKAPKCKEAMCLYSGYSSNTDTYQRVYLADARLIFDDQYIEPRQQIEVFCNKKKQYELYVNSTETYLEEFISECRYGQFEHKREEFPTCIERRCSFSVSSKVCFWMDDREHCNANNFTIPSRSSVHMRCRDGYKLSRSEDGSSVEVDGDALIMCNRGAYDESYRCISVSSHYGENFDCDPPWEKLYQTCVQFVKAKPFPTWPEARSSCISMNSDLLSINDREENTKIIPLLKQHVKSMDTLKWWIGLRQARSSWRWVDNDKGYDKIPQWGPNSGRIVNPYDNSLHVNRCVYLNFQGYLTDVECTAERKPYICEQFKSMNKFTGFLYF